MAEKNIITQKAIVDTYAIIADLTGQAPRRAARLLDKIRLGRIKGIIHPLIVYELAYHWKRGRLPFLDEKELLEFVNTYFTSETITHSIAVKASATKIRGDKLLASSQEPRLKRRRLSICDATSLVFAQKLNAPIITGDKDLSYTAKMLGINIIW